MSLNVSFNRTAAEQRTPVLALEDVSIAYSSGTQSQRVVHNVSFSIYPGEVVALVGESGSGKSVTGLALLRLTPPAPACRVEGQVLLRRKDGNTVDLLALREEEMRAMRTA